MIKNKFLYTTLIVCFFCRTFLLTAQTYTIDVSKRHQTIANFGASDCWTTQFFGLWPDDKKNAMADLLFSMDTDLSGKPKGIGLSLWRFNIGAGSAEQGKNSYIANPTRRAECFQEPDGTYNWEKQAGQRWFLNAAKLRGVDQFLAFNISPPIQMTMNGLAGNKFRPKDGTLNLKPDRYDDFADFLATVVDEVGKREGIKFQYISPFNEPEWDWDGIGQEGTPALVSEISKTVRILDTKLSEKKLDTKILVTESGQYDYMYSSGTNLPGRDDQIEKLFNPASSDYIGDLKHVLPMMVGHSYWTTSPVDTLISKRMQLRKALDKRNLDFWHTELCIMSNDNEIGGGGKKDLGMNTALYVARIIHHDLCLANASAWHWWLAITNSDYKDGLVYVTPDPDYKNGSFTDSKLLWAVGNFSRFVRPGAVRLDVNSSGNVNDPVGLMVSSYVHEKDKKLIHVFINYSTVDKVVEIKTKGAKVVEYIPYLTSDKETENLLPLPKVKSNNKIKIPARSVMTLEGNI